MNYLILTDVWGRFPTTDLVFNQIKRLKDNGNKDWSIDVLAAISEEGAKHLCYKYFFPFIEVPNSPLGAKKQARIDHIEGKQFDYIIILGSDDLMSAHHVWTLHKYALMGYDFIGTQDTYFVENGKCKYWKGYTDHRKGISVGAGRMFSRKLLSELGWDLWDRSATRAMDAQVDKRLANVVSNRKMVFNAKNEGVGIVGIKDEDSLTAFNEFPENEVDLKNYVLSNFGTTAYNTLL